MIRKDGVGKAADDLVDPANPSTHFREATWEEAMERAASGLKKIRDRDGSQALAGFRSAQGSQPAADLFHNHAPTALRPNNPAPPSRPPPASSVPPPLPS